MHLHENFLVINYLPITITLNATKRICRRRRRCKKKWIGSLLVPLPVVVKLNGCCRIKLRLPRVDALVGKVMLFMQGGWIARKNPNCSCRNGDETINGGDPERYKKTATWFLHLLIYLNKRRSRHGLDVRKCVLVDNLNALVIFRELQLHYNFLRKPAMTTTELH